MYVIYALVDPRDNTVRYVGITNDVYKRFIQHIQGSGNNYAKNAWIHELRTANQLVLMETLESVDSRSLALEREEYWIRHFEALKEPIANINKTLSPRKVKKTGLQAGRSVKQKVERVPILEPEQSPIELPMPVLAPVAIQERVTTDLLPFSTAKLKYVQAKLLARETQNKIICTVWNVQENSRQFRVAKEEFQLMLAYLASMAREA